MIWEWFKDWAQIIGAGITLLAVLVALGLGLVNMRQTKNIQEQQYKHTLFRDIKGWAREVVASIDEYNRGINMPEWHEQWSILRATKIGMISQAKKINNGFEKKVEKAVKLFEAFDQDLANSVKSNNPEECKESCKEILESDPIEYI
jgi:hypothetical protein